MNFNFELILFYAVIISGVVALIDIIFFAPARKRAYTTLTAALPNHLPHPVQKLPLIFDYARSFFPILLMVFLLRSFLYEPFRIPSGSLEPTLRPGDFILVNKFDYGIRLPIIHKTIFHTAIPKRGDIFVFRWPPNPSIDYIKRIIGLPGDHINYVNKVLYINGKQMTQKYVQAAQDIDAGGQVWNVHEQEENLTGVEHHIYLRPDRNRDDYRNVIVPPDMYFAMGDNRDDSADSRYFGFVPQQNIVGKAVLVWMSWDSAKHWIRWDRLGKLIH